MIKILQLYIFNGKINWTNKLNSWYFFLQKIPLLGKRLPQGFYQVSGFKNFLNYFSLITGWLMLPFFKIFHWGVAYAIGFVSYQTLTGKNIAIFSGLHSEIYPYMATFFIFFVGVIVNGVFRYLGNLSGQDVETLLGFQLPRKAFLYGQLYVDQGVKLLAYLPAFLILGALGMPLLLVINAYASLLVFPLLADGFLRLKIFKNPSKIMTKTIGWSVTGVFLVTFLGNLYLLWQQDTTVFQSLGYSLFLLLSFIFYFWVVRKDDEEKFLYFLVSDQLTNLQSATDAVAGNDLLLDGINLEKKLALEKQQTTTFSLNEKQALNQLLFRRYWSVLKTGFLIRLGLILAVGLAVSLMSFFVTGLSEKDLVELVPLLFFIMYLVGYGKKIVQVCFVNCDNSMLYYPFYRQEKVILSGFFYRFKKVLQYNGVLSLGILLGLTLTIFASEILHPAAIFFLLFFTLLGVTLLFSFHELFIYYLLQPFTSDFKSVNPLYRFLSAGMYWVAYLNLRLNHTGYLYGFIVMGVSFLYVAIGTFVIYKKAPKTFRIKG